MQELYAYISHVTPDGWMYYFDNDNMYILIHLVARQKCFMIVHS